MPVAQQRLHSSPRVDELEQRVAELELQLQQSERLASVGLTLAGMAHTIKNILGGLEGGVYVVDSGLRGDNTDRVRGGWNMVRQYIEQLTVLVQNMLSYSRPGEQHREAVDPGALARGVLELYDSKAEMVNIQLTLQVDEGLPELSLDRPAMHACLANLVTNALDACMCDPEDTEAHEIIIATRTRPPGGVTFEVRDNGMGISGADQDKILTTSFTTKGIRGTGLGLLMTKKSVREHGGRISFASARGRGTSFCIDLPGDGEPLDPGPVKRKWREP